MTVPTFPLADGGELPAVGFGTYQLDGDGGVRAIVSALNAGYRLLDTAVNYGNEDVVGRAIRESGIDRARILVTSKIPGRDQAYADAIRSTEESLKRLGLDYLDLHLIHWPNPSQGLYPQAWRALIALRERGLVREIGVCNFTEAYLRDIIDSTGVTPVVNQIELHPLFPQAHMREVHRALGIVTQAWSPLGKRKAPFDEPAVAEPARRLGVAPAQVILRWHHQLGSLPIPKSATPQRQRENLDIFGFELTDGEMAAISTLGQPNGRLFDGDPDTHEEM